MGDLVGWVGAITGVLGLAVSGLTYFLTMHRRGELKMTRPTFLAFSADPEGDGPKVYLRGMLFSTAQRGQVLENMFVLLARGESTQKLNRWVYRQDSEYQRGSGLFVGQDGVSVDHHFTLPVDGTPFRFLAGKHTLTVNATLAGKDDEEPITLAKIPLVLTDEEAAAIGGGDKAVFFDWGPDSKSYHSYIDTRIGEKRALRAPVLPLQGALLVDLLAQDEGSVWLKDIQTDVKLVVRVTNVSSFRIKLTGLRLKWGISGKAFRNEETQEVADQFETLAPGSDQIFYVAVRTTPFRGENLEFARVWIAGTIVADAEQWGGPKKAEIASYTYAKVVDERRPPKVATDG